MERHNGLERCSNGTPTLIDLRNLRHPHGVVWVGGFPSAFFLVREVLELPKKYPYDPCIYGIFTYYFT